MQRISLSVALPRGPEHYWQMMVELTAKSGGFTITDIWQLTNSRTRNTIKNYVHVCCDQQQITSRGEGANGSTVYAVVNLNAPAPVIRRPDYQDKRGRVRQQLWTTMRGLPRFTIAELVVEASTDEIAVGPSCARLYVQALAEAGYLDTIRPSVKLKSRGVFRLKPGMDTGPKAPAVLQTAFVIDRNRKEPVGAAVGEAEERA